MEKLIVRNFGPIKDAELELSKYVIFIGDTSTGKSVLAKLITIFREGIFSVNFQVVNFELKQTLNFNFKEQLEYLNIDFDFKGSEIIYQSSKYDFKILNGKVKYIGGKGYSKKEYIRKIINNEFLKNNIDIFKSIPSLNLNAINKPSYFPAERILLSIVGSSVSGLWANNVNLPDYFKDFAANFDIAKSKKKTVIYDQFGFKFITDKDIDKIIIDNIAFELSKMSSGIQSLVPLLLTFDNEVNQKTIKTILIEEPELNLFPSKQKTLIDYLVERINGDFHNLILTTHSPYVLSCLNTLLLANNTYDENPDKIDEISKIVPITRWIDFKNISVYEVVNGTVKSLKEEEFKSIDGNAIDEVSNSISNEFDKLLEIRYE